MVTETAPPLDQAHAEQVVLQAETDVEDDTPELTTPVTSPAEPAVPAAVPPLQSAFAKLQRIEKGEEADDLALTPAEIKAFNGYQREEAERVQTTAQAQEQYRQYVGRLDASHDTAATAIETAITEGLEEVGAELSVSAQRNLKRTIADHLTGLRAEAVNIVLEPLAAVERERLVATLSDPAAPLMTAAQARGLVQALPLVGATPQADSIGHRLFLAGYARGQRAGAGADTVSLAKKDYDAAIAAARKAGEDSVKAAGGAGLPASGEGARGGGAPNIRTQAEADIAHIQGKITHAERERIRANRSIPQQ